MRWNLPNILTIMRLLAAPTVAMIFIVVDRPFADFIALVLFVVAALTDFLDGYLARKWHQESNFGRMLDPIADKAMVVIALAILTALSQLEYWIVIPAVIIMFREIFVSGLREFLGDKASLLQVTKLAKWKTTAQMFAIASLFFATGAQYTHFSLYTMVEPSEYQEIMATGRWDEHHIYSTFISAHYSAWMSYVLLWLSSALTLITGWDYLIKAMPYLRDDRK